MRESLWISLGSVIVFQILITFLFCEQVLSTMKLLLFLPKSSDLPFYFQVELILTILIKISYHMPPIISILHCAYSSTLMFFSFSLNFNTYAYAYCFECSIYPLIFVRLRFDSSTLSFLTRAGTSILILPSVSK